MKKIIFFLFIVFGVMPGCFAAHNATDIYLLAQTNSASELKKIENIDVVDSDGNTALCSAIKYNDVDAYNILKKAGANTEHKCIKKIPTEQYQTFIQKVATANKSLAVLGLSETAWGIVGLGVIGGAAIATAVSGKDSGKASNNGDLSCQERGYTYKYSDACPDGWIKNSTDVCNDNGVATWFKCDIANTCSAPYYTECDNGYEEVPGDMCLSGSVVYKRCVEAPCVGFDKIITSQCEEGWQKGSFCLSGTVMKYKCDVPAACPGYQMSCGFGYIEDPGNTCKSADNTLVWCVFDDNNYIQQGGQIYAKLNCVHGNQNTNVCNCETGWYGDLCDTPVACPGYQTSCGYGYIEVVGDTCQSGNNTLVKCEFDSEHYIQQGGQVYQKLNCGHGTQNANLCTCDTGWLGTLCDTFDDVNYIIQGDQVYQKLNCMHGNQNANLCTCDTGWLGTLCDTFDDVNYIIQGGQVFPKLNCVHGNQNANVCACETGWNGDLCDTPAACPGYQASCDYGYIEIGGDTCQSGDNTLVKCEFDSEHYIQQGGQVFPKLNCAHGIQNANLCVCDTGWLGTLCDTFDDVNYIIQGGQVFPKLNCVHGTQNASFCVCETGWTDNLCDIPAACSGYQASCGYGYIEVVGDICQSGDNTLVKCEFDSEHYIQQGGQVFPKLNCVHGNQNANVCVCDTGWLGTLCDTFDDVNYIIQGGQVFPKLNCVHGTQNASFCVCETGWDGDLCDTPATCYYHTTECTGGYVPTGNTCLSGFTEYIECEPIQCDPGQAWTPSGCVTQTNVVINNTNSTGTVYGRYNEEANADNISATITITNSASPDVMAMFLGSMYFDTANVRVRTQSLQPGNENITGNITINNSTDNEIYGIFSDEWAGNARNLYYDHANLNEHSLNLTSTINITDSGNTGEAVGMNGRYWQKNISNLYLEQYGDGETWMSAHINANITINNLGDKPVYGIRGFNLYNAYSNYEINTVNSNDSYVVGEINIINNGSGDAYGIYLKPVNAATNIAVNAHNANGIITIRNNGSGTAYGMYGKTLTNLDTSGSANDVNGVIQLYNYANGNVFGMHGTNISNEALSSDSTSQIKLNNVGSGQAVGIYTTNTAVNSGIIDINNIGSGTAIGMFGDADSTITNSGIIQISRESFYDSGVYTPTGTAGDVFGIYAKSGSTVTNSGTINITTNGNAYGIYVEPNSTVVNTGTIYINGTPCSGVDCNTGNYIVLNGSTLYNTGVVAAPQMNLNTMGGNVVAGLGSKFIVENELTGDLNISSELVQNGNQTTYIAQNMIDAGDVSGLNVRSASAMFNASLADNCHDVVMQMKDFAELTDNKSLATFMANNYLNDNGTDLFSALKSADNMIAFNGTLSGLTGLNTFTQFAHEDLSAMREISFSMNNKLFENSDHDSFNISDSMGYFSFSNSHNVGSGQYGISSNKINDNWKLGYGMAMANINTGNGDDMHRQNKIWLFYAPATYTKNNYELVIAPKAGFARSEYNRRGYNNNNYDGYIEKQILGVMNDLRYPLALGNWTLAPDLAFNAIVYKQSGHEYEQEFSLVIPDDKMVSVETGLGLYTKYEKEFSDGGRLKLNSGLMVYREFGDSYDIKLGMRGMDGTFSLYNNDYEYRGAASLGFDYASGRLHLYGNAQYFMDNNNYMNVKGGISYRF